MLPRRLPRAYEHREQLRAVLDRGKFREPGQPNGHVRDDGRTVARRSARWLGQISERPFGAAHPHADQAQPPPAVDRGRRGRACTSCTRLAIWVTRGSTITL